MHRANISAGKDTAYKAWWPKFDPWDPRGEGTAPPSCSLSSKCLVWQVHPPPPCTCVCTRMHARAYVHMYTLNKDNLLRKITLGVGDLVQ